MEMEMKTGDRDAERASTPFCTFHFFDCLSSKDEDAQKRTSLYSYVKREKDVLDQQPHLVEPMKLRVYEDLPSTPLPPEPSQLTQWGRNLASRASSRASKTSTRRKTTFKSMISRPQPIPETTNDLPFRRRRAFSPIELSIYAESSRLSSLPEFDRFSFTDLGELKLPPKALLRTQSETLLRKPSQLITEPPKRTASMFEPGDIIFARPGTSCSIISTSRPPSEHDALRSHPVSWASLPGIQVSKSQKADNTVAVMTPMQEEFSPTAVTVGETILNFPKAVTQSRTENDAHTTTSPASQAPYPTVCSGPQSAAKNRPKTARPSYLPTTSTQTQKRISQWLQYRNNSTSTSTIGSFSTTASFAEHRRKRSEFYKLGQQTQCPPTAITTSPIPSSQPLNFNFSRTTLPSTTTSTPQFDAIDLLTTEPQRPVHERTNTDSTYHTTNTSLLSSAFDHSSTPSSSPKSSSSMTSDQRTSQDSHTTYSNTTPAATAHKSPFGTIQSVTSSTVGLKIVTPEKNKKGLISPALRGEIHSVVDDDVEGDCDDRPGPAVLEKADSEGEVYLEEINGLLRSPGVGIAF